MLKDYIAIYFANTSLQFVVVQISTIAFQNEEWSAFGSVDSEDDSATCLPSLQLALNDISLKVLWLQATEMLCKNMDTSLGSKGKTKINSDVI